MSEPFLSFKGSLWHFGTCIDFQCALKKLKQLSECGSWCQLTTVVASHLKPKFLSMISVCSLLIAVVEEFHELRISGLYLLIPDVRETSSSRLLRSITQILLPVCCSQNSIYIVK